MEKLTVGRKVKVLCWSTQPLGRIVALAPGWVVVSLWSDLLQRDVQFPFMYTEVQPVSEGTQ